MDKRRRLSAGDALTAAAMKRFHEQVMNAGRSNLEEAGALRNGTSADVMSQVGADAVPPSGGGAAVAQGAGANRGTAPAPAQPTKMSDRLSSYARDEDDERTAKIRERLMREATGALDGLRGSGRYGM